MLIIMNKIGSERLQWTTHSIGLLSKTFRHCNCLNRTSDNRNISKKNHLWTMQKLSWAYFGTNAIFSMHEDIFSIMFCVCESVFVCVRVCHGCEFDISNLYKSNTSWANTYFEYIWVISFSFYIYFNAFLSRSHFTIFLNQFLCIVCRRRHSNT